MKGMGEKPEDFSDASAWCRYFRWTMGIFTFPVKFDAAMREAPTPDAENTVITAYAACVIDIISSLGYQPEDCVSSMAISFHLYPHHFLMKKTKDIADLMGSPAEAVEKFLNHAGFLIHEGKIIGSPGHPAMPKPKAPHAYPGY